MTMTDMTDADGRTGTREDPVETLIWRTPAHRQAMLTSGFVLALLALNSEAIIVPWMMLLVHGSFFGLPANDISNFDVGLSILWVLMGVLYAALITTVARALADPARRPGLRVDGAGLHVDIGAYNGLGGAAFWLPQRLTIPHAALTAWARPGGPDGALELQFDTGRLGAPARRAMAALPGVASNMSAARMMTRDGLLRFTPASGRPDLGRGRENRARIAHLAEALRRVAPEKEAP